MIYTIAFVLGLVLGGILGVCLAYGLTYLAKLLFLEKCKVCGQFIPRVISKFNNQPGSPFKGRCMKCLPLNVRHGYQGRLRGDEIWRLKL